MKNKQNIVYILVEILSFILLLALSGIVSLFSVKFDFTKITSAEYWTNVITNSVAYSAILVISQITRLQKEISSNKTFSDLMIKYRTLLKLKGDDFTFFIDKIKNPKLQKDAYENHIHQKLAKMDKHANYELRLAFSDYLDALKNKKEYIFKTKIIKRYCLKRYNLEKMLLPEIESHECVNYSKYTKVSSYAFSDDCESVLGSHEDYNNVYNNSGRDLTFNTFKKLFNCIIFAAISGSIIMTVTNPDVSVYYILLDLLTILFGLLASFFTGYYNGKKIFVKNYIQVINHRNNILNEYISWDSSHANTVTPTIKILQYLDDQDKLQEKVSAKEENKDEKK